MTAPQPTNDPAWLPDPSLPFWKPSLVLSIRQFRRRAPLLAASMVIFPAILFWLVYLQGYVWILAFWKIILFLMAIPIGIAVSTIRQAVQNRKEKFCIHCGYSLEGLPDHHLCPECGRPYCFRLIDEYRNDPDWFIQRCRNHLKIAATHLPFEAGPVPSPPSADGT